MVVRCYLEEWSALAQLGLLLTAKGTLALCFTVPICSIAGINNRRRVVVTGNLRVWTQDLYSGTCRVHLNIPKTALLLPCRHFSVLLPHRVREHTIDQFLLHFLKKTFQFSAVVFFCTYFFYQASLTAVLWFMLWYICPAAREPVLHQNTGNY